jgi:hypothetical protein
MVSNVALLHWEAMEPHLHDQPYAEARGFQEQLRKARGCKPMPKVWFQVVGAFVYCSL